MYWDCTKHRDDLWISDGCTVYHKEQGQLCWWECHWDCIIYHPIIFKDKSAAAKWIGEGCIGQLQEGLTCLQIGFSKVCFREHIFNPLTGERE